ncbi:hypothetical protein Tco_1042176 [Tanacetum coccineum]|uniref:Reverse transcriptase domain-containing protein n=1 Tax=Tanacetum coccineum TaxID=301880 RepID=A0ABQ5GIA0_9ASTR
MSNGLKVPSNLKSYDGLSDPNDHLTMFMGTMDVHRLPEPAWCRIFSITLCGAARFWAEEANDANRFRDSKKWNKTEKSELRSSNNKYEVIKEKLKREA